MGRVRKSVRWVMGLAVVIAVAGAVGVASGAIPGLNGTISGCYAKATGLLRVIDAEAGKACLATSEVPIRWSQTGPQGPTGPRGATGPQGATGPAGPPPSAFSASGSVEIPRQAKATVVTLPLKPGEYALT